MAHVIRFDEGYHLDAGWFWDQLVPDHPPKKGKYNVASFIPSNWQLYKEWLTNLSNEVALKGASFGLTAPQITSVQATCSAMIAKIDVLIAAENAYNAALEDARNFKGTTDTALREEIGDWKRASGWTEATASALRVVSTRPGFNPDTYKPDYTVKIVGGEIRIDWKKMGADGVNVYARLRGQPGWIKLGMDTNSPYIDGRPLAQAGVPETREYMLRGVVEDEEIGLDSDILSVTWGGN